MNTPLLTITDLSYTYLTLQSTTKALSDINFTLYPGEFLAVVGPSGCGKSTLLNLISGLLEPTTGSITPSSTDPHSPKIGYMFQKDHLLSWRTVLSNIYLGLEIQQQLTDENKERIDTLLKAYGLWEFRDYHPHQLSGGMRQRVALIRTLALSPDLLLLDEPFSALDYQSRRVLADEVWHILKQQKKTALLITHDLEEAIALSDRILILSNRPGTIKKELDIQFGMPRPSPLFTKDYSLFRKYTQYLWKELDDEYSQRLYKENQVP